VTSSRRDVARELLPVGADERGDLLFAGRNARFIECSKPRLDSGQDCVDQRPVEVEDDRRRIGQLGETAQRTRPLRKTKATTPATAAPAMSRAIMTSLLLVG
jgi:hypothetical protein